jgi:SAM-dependent methyltransferase
LSDYLEMSSFLRCPSCSAKPLFESNGGSEHFKCSNCEEYFPLIDGIPCLLPRELREALYSDLKINPTEDKKIATAKSFGFEWATFPEMYSHWERNFLGYMAPHGPEFFKGKRVLDAGSGSGRHAFYASRFGAEVWAIDIGPAVHVTRKNTRDCKVNVIQADIYNLPFEEESFDFIYSIGVLHHLPSPEEAFRNLLRYLKPGGEIQIYLYWKPEKQPIKSVLLSSAAAVRRVTTLLPHRFVYWLSYPAAFLAYLMFILPYKGMRSIGSLQLLAEQMPMKQYADYPFQVCVNDQLDRFSAPIENRYTRSEVENWLRSAGLENITVSKNFGWVGTGRKPLQ